ncbi:mitochondrial import inner membrane translocase subunit TIM50-like [Selaginella moellendorffii]|uniref:mitochondrial import inner membrane translocase subunit TIM50-like n=1 Tax=Selaginella moellendorffii TaxID=88036 RepID=UPI000D1C78D0|nr:mitochondrial import inner membrane translocase subunit TIM50-like [Selaginella moellendorffii]|eukprot:XP_024530841.1 mitochondrial import inner membrane translocase subunit TIM50-like [Selaginella moellendorffii]
MGLVGNLQEEAAALVEVLGERLYQATVAASTNVLKSKEACSFVVLTRSLFSKSWIAWIGQTAVSWTKPLRLVELQGWLREEMDRGVLVLDLDDTLICRKNSTIVKRPGLEEFLSKMVQVYKLIIFSASDSKQCVAGFGAFAHLISEVYSIKDCTRCRQGFVKDVSQFATCSMKRLVWVDDVRLNFRLCPHNGIEIRPFKGEADDRELEKLTPLLLKLSKVEDVTQFLWNGQPKVLEAQEQSTKNLGKAKPKKKGK